jgi:hypothetical protein
MSVLICVTRYVSAFVFLPDTLPPPVPAMYLYIRMTSGATRISQPTVIFETDSRKSYIVKTPKTNVLYVYVYIYIYMCVCVCLKAFDGHVTRRRGILHFLVTKLFYYPSECTTLPTR